MGGHVCVNVCILLATQLLEMEAPHPSAWINLLRRGPLPSPAAATARAQRACRPQEAGPSLLLYTHFVHFYLRSKKLNLLTLIKYI